jgi:hypothetical protein
MGTKVNIMNLVFESTVDAVYLNFVSCPDINSSGIKRFTPCPIAIAMLSLLIFRSTTRHPETIDFLKNLKISTQIPDSTFIIPSGVAHSPDIWCGDTRKYDSCYCNKSLFSWLNDDYLSALRNRKAFLLLDQSHEGYQTSWLWDWFHENCLSYNIDPSRIIYVTGNLDCNDQYMNWCKEHKPVSQMLVVPYAHFEIVIGMTAQNYNNGIVPMHRKLHKLPTFEDHIEYKKFNNIKTFNVLQKRVRNHRIWLFKLLNDNNLITDNIVSMNSFNRMQSFLDNSSITEIDEKNLTELTPIMPPENPLRGTLDEFSSGDCGEYLNALNEQIMLDTWCSIVSEASFSDLENTCFLSEKTFKPIACSHPFIIFGNRGSLKRLKEMGYKTFHPFIDETYDELPTWERMDAIIKEMIRINSMSVDQKLDWYMSMKHILEHNSKLLIQNSHSIHSSYMKIQKYVQNV